MKRCAIKVAYKSKVFIPIPFILRAKIATTKKSLKKFKSQRITQYKYSQSTRPNPFHPLKKQMINKNSKIQQFRKVYDKNPLFPSPQKVQKSKRIIKVCSRSKAFRFPKISRFRTILRFALSHACARTRPV